MSFSLDMRKVVEDLLTELGNECVLTKITTGEYNTSTGRTDDIKERVGTYSTSLENASLMLSDGDNRNFNLSGFSEDKIMIPYIQGYDIDDTWLCNGDDIVSVEEVKSQNNTIYYILEVKGK